MNISDESWKEWLPNNPDTFSSVPREDKPLSGIRLPLTEEAVRRTAAKPLRPTRPYYEPGEFLRRLDNMLIRSCRIHVQRVDAESAWENEGGR